ncbi:MAG: D-aminoacylase [Acidobacteria bacterium]|nr:D-aminoacylase [Acidobacteriota bacterium]
MLKKFFVVGFTIGLIISAPFFSARATLPDYDLAIINGRIVDGTGNPWFYGSIAIKSDRIVAVGAVDVQGAARVIDAQGQIVAPGFIDVHTHVEGNLGDHPTADNFLHMGVTSIVTGNCGASVIEVGKFLSDLESKGIAINLATLIGHGSVRREVMNEEDRVPTPEELQRMRDLVDKAMREGAVGISTGLIYVPGTYAKTGEIVELAKVVARHGGIYATHMRDEGNKVIDSIQESLTIGAQAQLPVEISHFKVSSKKLWGASLTTCRMVAEARMRGQQVTVDQYVYTASATSLNTALPSWVLEGGRDKAQARLADPLRRAKIKREMIASINESGFKDWSYAVVAGYSANPAYEGKSISEITKMVRGRTGADDEAEQIITMYLQGSAGMIYHKMAEADVERILAQPFTMIASDSGVQTLGNGVPHPRGYGNNARVLGVYVREKKIITLEDAVRKMTSLPAATFKLWDRGLLRKGCAADLVIFDEKTIGDQSSFANPHQFAKGLRFVLVNGKPVIDNGVQTKTLAGRALYGTGKNSL